MFLLNVSFLGNFQEIIGNISGKILQGLNLMFGSVSIFLKVIEKHLFMKIQKHEKQKALIENQTNSIRNMVSKALSNNEISEGEFEKILFETEKYRKKVETRSAESEVPSSDSDSDSWKFRLSDSDSNSDSDSDSGPTPIFSCISYLK